MIYFVLFFIGICNALSLPLTGSVLSIWLTEENFTKEMIGMYALLGLPFSVKIIWSPIIDQFSLPFFRLLLLRDEPSTPGNRCSQKRMDDLCFRRYRTFFAFFKFALS